MGCPCGRRKCTCQKRLCTGGEGCSCFSCRELHKKCALCRFQIPAAHFSGGNSQANEESDICRCFLWGDQDGNISNEALASADLPTVSIAGPSNIPESNPEVLGASVLRESKIFSSQITADQSEKVTTSEHKPRKDRPTTVASNRSHKPFSLSTEKDAWNIPKGRTNLSKRRVNRGKSERYESVKREEVSETLQGIEKADKNQKNETFTTTSNISFRQNFGLNPSTRNPLPFRSQNNFNDLERSALNRFQQNPQPRGTIYMGIQTQSTIRPHPHTYVIPVLNSSTRTSSLPHQQRYGIPVFNRSAENSSHPYQKNYGIPILNRFPENSPRPRNNLQQRALHPPANGSRRSFLPYHTRNPTPMELPQIRPFQMIPGRPYGIARCENPYFHRIPQVMPESATRQKVETWLTQHDFLAEECRPPLSTRSNEIRDHFAELPFANESTSNEEGTRNSTSPRPINDADSSNGSVFF